MDERPVGTGAATAAAGNGASPTYPQARFHVTVSLDGVTVLDGADSRTYCFPSLLEALSHMETVLQRQQGVSPGP